VGETVISTTFNEEEKKYFLALRVLRQCPLVFQEEARLNAKRKS
jgi:hypothetical protein